MFSHCSDDPCHDIATWLALIGLNQGTQNGLDEKINVRPMGPKKASPQPDMNLTITVVHQDDEGLIEVSDATGYKTNLNASKHRQDITLKSLQAII